MTGQKRKDLRSVFLTISKLHIVFSAMPLWYRRGLYRDVSKSANTLRPQIRRLRVTYFLMKKVCIYVLFEVFLHTMQRLLARYCKIKNTRHMLKRVVLRTKANVIL